MEAQNLDLYSVSILASSSLSLHKKPLDHISMLMYVSAWGELSKARTTSEERNSSVAEEKPSKVKRLRIQ